MQDFCKSLCRGFSVSVSSHSPETSRTAGDTELSTSECVGPVMNCSPVQREPASHPVSAGISSSLPQPCRSYRWWTDGWLLLLLLLLTFHFLFLTVSPHQSCASRHLSPPVQSGLRFLPLMFFYFDHPACVPRASSSSGGFCQVFPACIFGLAHFFVPLFACLDSAFGSPFCYNHNTEDTLQPRTPLDDYNRMNQ